MLQESVRQLSLKVGLARADPDASWQSQVVDDGWRTLRDMGLLALRSDTGGTGIECAVVCEELAAASSPVPFGWQAVVAGQLLRSAGGPPALGEALAGGRQRVAVAVRADLRQLEGDGTWIVTSPAGVDAALALDEGGAVRLYDVGSMPEQSWRALTLDPWLRGLTLRGPLDDHGVVGRLDSEGRDLVTATALTVTAADLVGVARDALRDAVAHARRRIQFGRPIGAFQAVQELCAVSEVAVRSARGCVWYAGWALDAQDAKGALQAARVAKARAAAAGRLVCENAVQVLGGLGVTWESLAHRRLRRALFDRALLGDERQQYRRIAEVRLATAGKGERPL